MDEIDVVSCCDLQLVTQHFVLYFFAEMMVNPPDLGNRQTPFDITHYNEIVDSRITVLVVVCCQLFLSVIIQLQKQKIFEDSNILFVTVIRTPFVFPFLFVDNIHFLLESDLFNKLFHLFLIVGFGGPGLETMLMTGNDIKMRNKGREIAVKGGCIVWKIRCMV